MIHPQHERIVHLLVDDGELEIDAEGRVWRLKKRQWDRHAQTVRVVQCVRVRAESVTGDGYQQVRAMRDGRRVAAAAHRLVWFHFKGPIPDGLTINHENGIKSDNRPDNLALATYSEQRIHAVRVLGAGHADFRGERHPKATITATDVREMRARRSNGVPLRDIATAFGVTPKNASAICRGATWGHVT